MVEGEHRQITRDSLFVLADLRVIGEPGEHRVKIRNLSPGGLMAEGEVKVQRGARVTIDIRNIGWVDGSVAWVQDSRFGIALTEEIDPKIARLNVGGGDGTPRFTRPPLAQPDQPKVLRKI
ncbi:MAG: PilZ domain-containing protein [Novosphingobium sp.]|nr:PilZ domain-containing protein [Novosphingobium sp.]